MQVDDSFLIILISKKLADVTESVVKEVIKTILPNNRIEEKTKFALICLIQNGEITFTGAQFELLNSISEAVIL